MAELIVTPGGKAAPKRWRDCEGLGVPRLHLPPRVTAARDCGHCSTPLMQEVARG